MNNLIMQKLFCAVLYLFIVSKGVNLGQLKIGLKFIPLESQ